MRNQSPRQIGQPNWPTPGPFYFRLSRQNSRSAVPIFQIRSTPTNFSRLKFNDLSLWETPLCPHRHIKTKGEKVLPKKYNTFGVWATGEGGHRNNIPQGDNVRACVSLRNLEPNRALRSLH